MPDNRAKMEKEGGQKKTLMIAAPSSGCGKTLVTLALLRALKDAGMNMGSAKAGPDYIDPAFHEFSSGNASVNLDPWAMNSERLLQLANAQCGDFLLVEAMMGLFDGAADGTGSAAELAAKLLMPIVLVVDAARQSHSVAALVEGFCNHREDINVAGVILNKVGSSRHETILRDALEKTNIPVLGAVYRNASLALPERHLGLVQAGEQGSLEAFIANAAKIIASSCDLNRIAGLAAALPGVAGTGSAISPLGQRMAIARDEAFSFIYPHLLADWRTTGAEISFFSPLSDEAPHSDADAVFLPGGYPELHCAKLSAAQNFHGGMAKVVENKALIYGECGGYMVLGEGIIDAEGRGHKMLGLLNLETSFAKRKLHLGYRRLSARNGFVLGDKLMAHEFHYTVATMEKGDALFKAEDALGSDLGQSGLRRGNVMGSYMHVIDEAP